MTPVFELNDLHVSLQSRHKEIELVRGVSFAVARRMPRHSGGKRLRQVYVDEAAMGLLDHSFHVKAAHSFRGKSFWARVPRSCAVCAAGKSASFFRTR